MCLQQDDTVSFEGAFQLQVVYKHTKAITHFHKSTRHIELYGAEFRCAEPNWGRIQLSLQPVSELAIKNPELGIVGIISASGKQAFR